MDNRKSDDFRLEECFGCFQVLRAPQGPLRFFMNDLVCQEKLRYDNLLWDHLPTGKLGKVEETLSDDSGHILARFRF